MDQEEKNKAIVSRLMVEAFNNRRLELLPELLHEDFVNHNELLSVDSKTGPGVFKELYTKMWKAFPDIKIHNHLMIAKDDLVVIHDTLSGTNTGPTPDGEPATGNPVEFEAINILRIQDGKVIERWGLSDNLAMMRQLGQME